MNDLTEQNFFELFIHQVPLIDVRAPVEFGQGHLPGAVNLPLMNDEERAAVGTTYKKHGKEKAIELGHQLVSGNLRESRMQAWADFIKKQPDAVLYCFRGGLRSKTVQSWLGDRGLWLPLIQGGYKSGRQYLREQIDQFAEKNSMFMLSGSTGSGKTHFLRQVAKYYPSLDLEKYAVHRGSAFGALSEAQPTQIDFENILAVQAMKLSSGKGNFPVLIEDESRLIGRCAVPESFFLKMRESPLLYLEVSLTQRVENIFQDYIIQTPIGSAQDESKGRKQFQIYRTALEQISRKLGGVQTQEILKDLASSEQSYIKSPQDLESNKVWIEKLLRFYYDPFYTESLKRRDPKILIRGDEQTLKSYLKAVSVGAL